MKKFIAQFISVVVLCGLVVCQSEAATDVPAGDVTQTPAGESVEGSLPPEPGAETNPDADGDAVNLTKVLKEKLLRDKQQAELERQKKNALVEVQHSEFRGRYVGAKFGIINSGASGKTEAPSASTLAYGVQGGYIQGGYNWDLGAVVVGMGAYIDWNNYTIHSNNVAYASRAFGLDARLGYPMEYWFPYVKFGYGYSTGTRDEHLRTVAQNSSNAAIGVEYNVAARWSLVAEFKRDSFSNKDKSITINNRLFTFGFNYYMDKPLRVQVEEATEIDMTIPAPIIDPDAVPDQPPPP